MKPNLCPKCFFRGVIATKGGPTCTHAEPNGLKWWPEDWAKMAEHARVERIARMQEERLTTEKAAR